MRSRLFSAHGAPLAEISTEWRAVAAPLWCQLTCMLQPVTCLLTAPEGLVTGCSSRSEDNVPQLVCVQACEIADRLHLLPPIMDQCEYNLLKRDRVGH